MKSELPIPPAALQDVDSKELLRVWAAAGNQHISIATGVWENPTIWGIMLVDLLRHIARSYEKVGNVSYEESMRLIKAGFDAEWEIPTE